MMAERHHSIIPAKGSGSHVPPTTIHHETSGDGPLPTQGHEVLNYD